MRKYLCAAIAMLLLSSCTVQITGTSQTPPSSDSVGETSSQSEQETVQQPRFPGFDQIPGGVLYISSRNGSISYLLGADGLVDMGLITMKYDVTDSSRACYVKTAGGTPDGETALFDSTGKQLSDYDARALQLLAGNYIVRGNYEVTETDGYIFSTDVAFIDLTTGETAWEPGRCVVRPLDEEHLTVCVQETEEAVPTTMVVNISNLEIVKEFTGYYGTSDSWQYAPVPDSCLLLFDEGMENISLYALEREQLYPDYRREVGEAVLFGKDGSKQLLLPDGKMMSVPEGVEYWYWSDAIQYWQQADGSSYCSAACYGDQTIPVQYVQCDDYQQEYITVCKTDGSLDILSLDGELLVSMPFEQGKESFAVGNGWIMTRTADESAILTAPDGIVYTFDGMMNVWPLCQVDGQQYFSAQQSDYSMGVLDQEGNLLVSGLASVYAAAHESGLLVAVEGERVGLMDVEGNWLWREPEKG